jgi:nucleoside-diphosphate-sugar epimerase
MTTGHPETILVTGAFGQVGRRCVQLLLERGRTVVALDLHNEKSVETAAALSDGSGTGTLLPAYVNLLDAAAIDALFAQHRPGAVVHLAAMLAPTSYRNPAAARKVNVEGTRNLVDAARKLAEPPVFVFASSASVYGSINPHRHPERITSATPVNPIDQYGEDKVLAEAVVRDSGLPAAVLRLAGVISPDAQATISADHLVLVRATPGDNRMHTVDARDVALAFANAVDRGPAVAGKVLVIAGDESHVRTHRELEDAVMTAFGLGALGPHASLPGDPDDEDGWSFTGWFDTTDSQDLLGFQQHTWDETLAWTAASAARIRPILRVLGPVLRPALRTALAVQRRRENRGRYADPWTLISNHYGREALVGASDA